MLFTAVVIYPLLELWLSVEVIREFGFANAFFAWLFSFVLGVGLFRTSSLRLTVGVAKAMSEGKSPGVAAVDGALVGFAGVLFLVPGFISDVAAVLLLIPPLRGFFARRLIRKFQARSRMRGVNTASYQEAASEEVSSAIIDVDAVVVKEEPTVPPQLPKR